MKMKKFRIAISTALIIIFSIFVCGCDSNSTLIDATINGMEKSFKDKNESVFLSYIGDSNKKVFIIFKTLFKVINELELDDFQISISEKNKIDDIKYEK